MKLVIDRPVATAMVFLALLATGVYSFLNTPIELAPKEDFPKADIFTSWPGVPPGGRPDPGDGAARGGLRHGQGHHQDDLDLRDRLLPDHPGVRSQDEHGVRDAGPARGADEGPPAPAAARPAVRPALRSRGLPGPAVPRVHGLGPLRPPGAPGAGQGEARDRPGLGPGRLGRRGRRRLGARDPGHPRRGPDQGPRPPSLHGQRGHRGPARDLSDGTGPPRQPGVPVQVRRPHRQPRRAPPDRRRPLRREPHPGQGRGQGRGDLRRHPPDPPHQRPAHGQPDRLQGARREHAARRRATSSASSRRSSGSSRPTSPSRASTTRARRSARTSTTSISSPD